MTDSMVKQWERCARAESQGEKNVLVWQGAQSGESSELPFVGGKKGKGEGGFWTNSTQNGVWGKRGRSGVVKGRNKPGLVLDRGGIRSEEELVQW